MPKKRKADRWTPKRRKRTKLNIPQQPKDDTRRLDHPTVIQLLAPYLTPIEWHALVRLSKAANQSVSQWCQRQLRKRPPLRGEHYNDCRFVEYNNAIMPLYEIRGCSYYTADGICQRLNTLRPEHVIVAVYPKDLPCSVTMRMPSGDGRTTLNYTFGKARLSLFLYQAITCLHASKSGSRFEYIGLPGHYAEISRVDGLCLNHPPTWEQVWECIQPDIPSDIRRVDNIEASYTGRSNFIKRQ